MGASLAGHLAVDGVERGAGADGVAACELREAAHPDGPPLPRVLGEDLAGRPRDLVEALGLDRGAGAREPHLDGDGRREREGAEPDDRVGHVHAGQPRLRRVRLVDLEQRQGVPRQRPIDDIGHGRLEQRRLGRVQRGVPGPAVGGHDLAQHPEQLPAHLVDGREAVLRVGRAGLGDQAVERVVALEQRGLGDGRQRRHVGRLVAAEVEHERGDGAPDRVHVRRDRGPDLRHLRCLVADRAVDGRLVVVGPAHSAEVDQLDLVADLDHVVGLEVAVEHPVVVQVGEGGHHLEHERERLVDGQRVGRSPLASSRSFRICLRLGPPTYSITM